MSKASAWFDRTFKLTENGTTIKTELFAGLTTFFAMCYIIVVNPSTIGGENTAIWNSVYIGTILSAIIGTLLMAFVAKMPFAQAAGMGLNFLFLISFGSNISKENYGTGLAVVFLSGIIFLILSATGLRKYIATALPEGIKKAIPAGIGLFIAFIGLKNSGMVIANEGTLVGIGDFSNWATAGPMLAFFIGLILVAVLYKFKVKGAVIISILASTLLFYLMTWSLPDFSKGVFGVAAFGDFWSNGLFNFRFDLAFINVKVVFSSICLIISFCLVDMFDTIGTLYGTAAEAKMLDENGNPIRLGRCMLCDSIATVAGACLGSSTVTTYVESSAGVAAGGRTGLTSVIVAMMFFIFMFASPLASMIPGQATAVALVFVGVCMMKSAASVDFTDMAIAIPSFLTIIIMPLTYSISNGIAIGLISHTLIRLATLKIDKSLIVPGILSLLFIFNFISPIFFI